MRGSLKESKNLEQSSHFQNARTATGIPGNGQTANNAILKGARRTNLQKTEYAPGKVK